MAKAGEKLRPMSSKRQMAAGIDPVIGLAALPHLSLLSRLHRFNENPRRLIQIHRQRVLDVHPSKLLGLLVQLDLSLADATTGIIQQDKMGSPVELLRVNAILD